MSDEQLKEGRENSFKKFINASVVVMLVFLMFIALLSFFFNMERAIADLFDPRYKALMQALFSLFVLGFGAVLVKMFLSK
ncbi:MAG: hypothetical protein K0A89_11760 [ANME-2 cluster archaeon]|nr:hypothetical protein [ANME-2 cluster archaeon]MCL7474845.1 hypothetical protein [ANME-2 cluster archaeon]MDF1532116.1 hypothetical protein [ANME-2 cluster archaeon]MDW7774982.1 hypothetical protein [Methanosarcinales archaeon]